MFIKLANQLLKWHRDVQKHLFGVVTILLSSNLWSPPPAEENIRLFSC